MDNINDLIIDHNKILENTSFANIINLVSKEIDNMTYVWDMDNIYINQKGIFGSA